ncbi:hypothetical protein FKP32DRAFT_1680317 [Trametes sanguinea]|nr:hypothetical protein FKP32DRAFT_1680317 [Trametes sanguinea]
MTTLIIQTRYGLHAGPTPLKRDPDVWFDDGNVILVAQSAAFRVHESVLARHSNVFKCWFSGLCTRRHSPRHGPERLDGAQVLRLDAEATAYDLKQALSVIYGLLQVHDGAELTFSIVAALRRFAVDYEMFSLADASRRLLGPSFPRTLAEWDTHAQRSLPFNQGAHQAIEALNLVWLDAWEDETDEYFPAAIYHCARLPDDVLRAGAARADGTREALDERSARLLRHAKAQLKELGARMRARSGELQWRIHRRCYELGCRGAFESGMIAPEGLAADELAGGNVMDRWADEVIGELEGKSRICGECAKWAREYHDNLREDIWKEFADFMSGPLDSRWEADCK